MLSTKNGNDIDVIFGTGASSYKDYESLYPIIRSAFENKIRGFDTAPSYKTEAILGKCLTQCMSELGVTREDLFIQTKVDAWQMMENTSQIIEYVKNVMKKMEMNYLDALLIHWPVPELFDKTWDALVELQKEGLARNIGICNFRMRQLEQVPYYNVMPQIIQIERNPLRTCEREIEFCQSQNIVVQAYSPLCKMREEIRTNKILMNLADKYDKNVGQIVMRWHIDTGVIPIFTSKKTSRIREYADAAIGSFSLNNEEIKAVNMLNRDYKMYLESFACPGF